MSLQVAPASHDRSMSYPQYRFTLVLLLLAVLSGCTPTPERLLPATRGYIVISIDTLRADHLGAYGYERDTSPFFDSLAERGVLFENAVVQLPGTLPSHMSIFTGLNPREHGVYPPDGLLSPRIATLPEVFAREGFRTAGFTEGGYMSGHYGFARGFETFSDQVEGEADDVETTFERGREFLAALEPSERFFLFLHTYAVHDPYWPPKEYRHRFRTTPPPGGFPPTGANLSAVNRGKLSVTPEQVEYFKDLYDGSIRYVDDVLASWIGELEAMGLLDETTLIITSDHGEEFLDHGMMVHEQIYHENLHVPLLVLHPKIQGGERIPELVRSIDLAPTLYRIAGIAADHEMNGDSLVPLLMNGGDSETRVRTAFAEKYNRSTEALYHQSEAGLYHLLALRPEHEASGTWVRDSAVLDAYEPTIAFRATSFHQPRSVDVLVNGERITTLEMPPTWQEYVVPLPSEAAAPSIYRVEFRADGCISPAEAVGARDERCLAFKVRDMLIERLELFNVDQDPDEEQDLSRIDATRRQLLYEQLEGLEFSVVAPAGREQLDPELTERLKSLGYLQ